MPDPQTMTSGDKLATEGLSIEARSFGRQTWERFRRHRLAMISLVVLLVLISSFWIGPWLSPFDSRSRNSAARSLGLSVRHPFGTDVLGRDLMVRTLEGAQVSIYIAAIVALVSTAVGSVLGAIAGYFGKAVDAIVNQMINLILVVPSIVLLLVMGIKTGGSVTKTAFIVAFISWITIARIVRGLFLQMKEAEFVQAARAAGAGPGRIIFRHIMPNAMGPILVQITLVAGAAIIIEATLSFLGLGVQPPDASLGSIITDAKQFIDTKPSRVLIPGAILTTLVLCLNFIGDGLRDALDPTARRGRE